MSYAQIKRVADWQLHEEALRRALAVVVDAISNLETARVWGEGKTSSSDGQRFLFPRRTLKRTYSHRMSDYALEFYSFVADNYAPFYSAPIECTERDAAYVLDGLLYHESDLEIDEHYTDTHGYTEVAVRRVRAARQAVLPAHPRPAASSGSTDRGRGSAPLRPALAHAREAGPAAPAGLGRGGVGPARTVLLLDGDGAHDGVGGDEAGERLRRGNHFYRALRELGRAKKTVFVLEYLGRPALRRRVRRGLLKSEELHALARSVFYGKLGQGGRAGLPAAGLDGELPDARSSRASCTGRSARSSAW